jgi:hypothetical protein
MESKKDDPVGDQTAFPGHPDCVERRTAGSIAIGVGVELWFHLRLQDHLDDCLRHAIGDGRDLCGWAPNVLDATEDSRARNSDPVASLWLSRLLALEIATAWRPVDSIARSSRPYS